ncbi:MAG: hypothetical protein ACRD4V_02785 [Candidatus Acidiferrales bacterium]
MMKTMIATAQRLDWRDWILGIWGALVSGGAGAIGGGFGAMVADPSHDFTVGTPGGVRHLILVMAITFLFSGITSLAKFLQIHPTPEIGPNLLESKPNQAN